MKTDDFPELPPGWTWHVFSDGTIAACNEDDESVSVTQKQEGRPQEIRLSRGMHCAPIEVFDAVAEANGLRKGQET